ncbi:conserved hypothetical protein [Vibrio phage 150E35-1]|nr:conserved hypothetical protein [Vibrio phage 150E35-1]
MAIVTNVECRTLPDFATAYTWSVKMVKPPLGLSVPDKFNTICKTSTIPKREANAGAELVLHGHKRKLPGVEFSAGQLTLTFADLVDNRVRSFIRQWRELNHENQTGVAVPYMAAYATIQITLQNRLGVDTYRYVLHNCWCEDHDFGTELVEGTDTVLFDSVQMMISYDHFDEFEL